MKEAAYAPKCGLQKAAQSLGRITLGRVTRGPPRIATAMQLPIDLLRRHLLDLVLPCYKQRRKAPLCAKRPVDAGAEILLRTSLNGARRINGRERTWISNLLALSLDDGIGPGPIIAD